MTTEIVKSKTELAQEAASLKTRVRNMALALRESTEKAASLGGAAATGALVGIIEGAYPERAEKGVFGVPLELVAAGVSTVVAMQADDPMIASAALGASCASLGIATYKVGKEKGADMTHGPLGDGRGSRGSRGVSKADEEALRAALRT